MPELSEGYMLHGFSEAFPERIHDEAIAGLGRMSLVRISLREGRSAAYRRAIADGVHWAMVETMDVPALDRLQVITEHTPESVVYDPIHLDVPRIDDVVFVQILLNAGCSTEQKRALYVRIIKLLAENPGVQPQDIVMSLVEIAGENRSFGDGKAQ